jgi:hypothetical protein
MSTSYLKVTRGSDDKHIQSIVDEIRRKNIEKKMELGSKATFRMKCILQKYVTSSYYTPKYNYIMCVLTLFKNFPNILNNKNVSIILDSVKRADGLSKNTSLSVRKMEIMNKIMRSLFCVLVQHTGGNLLIDNIDEDTINDIVIYDTINQLTPVAFAMMLSKRTALIGCIHDSNAEELSQRITNNIMINDSVSPDLYENRSRVKAFFIKTKISLRSQSYNWGKKSKYMCYHNRSFNYTISLCDLIEYSNYMKNRA